MKGIDMIRIRLGGLLVLSVALVIAPLVLSNFLIFQLSMLLTYSIAVLGINLTLGFNGIVSLAQGALFATGSYATAILVTSCGLPWWLALPAGALLAGLVGLAVGLPTLRLGGLQLAILTFGVSAVVPQLLLKFPSLTNGISGIAFDKPMSPLWFPGNQDQWLYVLCLGVFLLYAIGVRRLLSGDSGRSLKALRDGPLVASALGLDATRIRLTAFVISSMMAGLGGGLFALVNAYVNPDSFQASLSIEFIIASVVGGLTSIAGALLGAAFVTFVPEWAASVNVALGSLIYGCALLLVVRLAPAGIVGLMEKALARLTSSRARTATSAPESAAAFPALAEPH